MSTCSRLDLQTLGSQLVIFKNLPDHWAASGPKNLAPTSIESAGENGFTLAICRTSKVSLRWMGEIRNNQVSQTSKK